ncbi:MAG: glycosyltransferase [Candidatus Pacebacteria bacterium]|nr:glycosyltransferase [Candidatus Paceibacterota bacterium]
MLSIIIPTLNEEKYLPKLLDSIQAQNYKDYEIIVSDGNSEDRTQEIARKRGCVVVSNKKRHPSYQRNDGAKIAKGKWLLFFDADISIPENFLKNTIEEAEKRNLKGAGFYIKIKNSSMFYRCLVNFLNFFFWLGQPIRPTSIGIAMLADREAHFKINGFDESLFVAEDYDYSYRLFKQFKVKMIKSSFIYYSPRRLEREGKIKVLKKWIKLAWYVIIKGPVKKKIVDYNFGEHK